MTNYVILFILSILIASFSQIILKKGSMQKNIYVNKYTICGYSLMIISILFTLMGYEKVSLSLGQVLQSLSFIFVIILSSIFLKEKFNKKQIFGIIIIIFGIIIYSI